MHLTYPAVMGKHKRVQTLISEANGHGSDAQITAVNRSIPLSSRVYKASFGLPP